MSLPAGAKIGAYEILGPLGAGGMGEVYRARDTKLNRDVALKVLPEAFANDAERMARFQREAQVLASLNHPNIAAIYGLEESGRARALVMELVEGETLAERIAWAHGRSPLQDALPIARQIAEALEAAHEKGIIHRDLKPANLKITPEGAVKILDFGLAKGLATELSGTNLSDSPTISIAATQAGVILGTAAYMSPEQAKGKSVDRRADIWAFGCVLYEMLCDRAAFNGESVTDTLAAVMRDEADFSKLPPGTPPAIERLIRRCLVKDPRQRLRDIGDVRLTIEEVLSGADSVASSAAADDRRVLEKAGDRRSPHQRALPWMAAFATAALAVAVLAYFFIPPPEPRIVSSEQITHDGLQKVSPDDLQNMWTDGSRIYFNEQAGNSWRLTQVSVTGGETVPVPSTIRQPVLLALDSARQELLVQDASGGDPQPPLWILPTLGGTGRRLGGVSGNDGVFSPDGKHIFYTKLSELAECNLDGSEARKLADTPGVVVFPRFSPDGSLLRFKMFSRDSRTPSLWEIHGDGTGLRQVLPDWNKPHDEEFGSWTADGRYFIFQARRAGTGNSNIWALPEKIGIFSRRRGDPVQLTSGPLDFYLPIPSPDGKKLYAIGVQRRAELLRHDASSGQFQPFLSSAWAEELSFSKDGNWVAYILYPEGTLWRSRLDGSEKLQLTVPPVIAAEPSFSPDGKRIAFLATSPGNPQKIFVVPQDGGTAEQLTTGNTPDFNPQWSADGKTIIYGTNPIWATEAKKFGIHVLDLASRRISLLPGSEGLWSPALSHDGRRLASLSSDYTSIKLYDFASQTWQDLATSPANNILWSHDDQYLYFDNYPNRDAAIMRVRVSDHKVERVLSLEGFRRAESPFLEFPWMGLAPDDSPLLLRDTGTQEIYALDVVLP